MSGNPPAWHRQISTTLRFAAWACVALLAVLSLLPAEELVRTSLSAHAEHALAYAGTAAAMRLGYPSRWGGRQIPMLIIYAGLLEYLQHFSPGRTPAVQDWLYSSLGVLAGSPVGGWLVGRVRSDVSTHSMRT